MRLEERLPTFLSLYDPAKDGLNLTSAQWAMVGAHWAMNPAQRFFTILSDLGYTADEGKEDAEVLFNQGVPRAAFTFLPYEVNHDAYSAWLDAYEDFGLTKSELKKLQEDKGEVPLSRRSATIKKSWWAYLAYLSKKPRPIYKVVSEIETERLKLYLPTASPVIKEIIEEELSKR